eukprot:6212299-Pyramimonas_sp.AAC.1
MAQLRRRLYSRTMASGTGPAGIPGRPTGIPGAAETIASPLLLTPPWSRDASGTNEMIDLAEY